MIHYAQLLLLTHLAEAAPRLILMTPWWVVTFLSCQLRGQLIGTGLHEFVSCSRNMSGILVVLPVLCHGNFLVEYST
jgi:hypothetical protein